MEIVFPTPGETLLLSTLLVSLFSPLVIGWLKQDRWPKLVRFGFAILFSAVVGIANAYGNGQFGEGAISATTAVIIVIIATQASYRLFFKDSGLDDALNPPSGKSDDE